MVDQHAPTLQATAPPMGLSGAEAALLLARQGPNLLPVPPSPPAWRALGVQLIHFFAIMLWVAGGLAFVAGMPQLGFAIFAVILINGLFAFAQEHRAERAAARLRDLLPRGVRVLRDGHRQEIPARAVVPGDVMFLEAGDRVCADILLLEADALAVDTSAMTGESVPAVAAAGDAAFAGTFVVAGEATAVVTATGSSTRLAALAGATRAGHRPPSPLAHELARVVRTLAAIAVAVGILFFGIALLAGSSADEGFLFAVGVTVALVPEGLLPTVTLSLSVGAQRMARRRALVRRLEAVEALGATTFICTDKTGTLTCNQMAVVAAWTPAGTVGITGEGYEPRGVCTGTPSALAAALPLALAARTASTGRAVQAQREWVAQGDPMEAALDAFARRLGAPANDSHSRVLRRFPFDSPRRRMSVATAEEVLVKGAPEAVLPLCRAGAEGAGRALEEFATRGLRVIAVARRPLGSALPSSATEAEDALDLLGLVAFEDPPRPAAAAAIASCRSLGIRVAMVTGDHPATAAAIAREVGLALPGAPLLEGRELPADDQVLGALLDRDGVVVARVTPEDKLRIARALQARGHVVAMTGDGVNDGPALQAADVGVAMGRSGTDVAREAADLVLLDDDFATMVAAVEEGRATFANMRRFLTYHLTDNVAELTPFVVWALSGGRIPLALGVLQVLSLDIGTDMLPALALGSEASDPGSRRHPLAGQHLIDRAVLWRVFAVLGPVEAAVEMAAFFAALVVAGWRPGDEFPSGHALAAASGAAFAAVVFGQVANAFACRSTSRWPGALGWTTNRFLIAAVAAELAILAALLFIPALASLLDQAPPPLVGAAVAVGAIPAVLIADLAHKRVRVRQRRSDSRGRPAGADGYGCSCESPRMTVVTASSNAPALALIGR